MLKHKEQSSPLPTVEEVPPKGVGIVNVRRDRNSCTGCADPSDKCFAPFVSEGWVLLTGKPRVRKMAFSPWRSIRHSRFVLLGNYIVGGKINPTREAEESTPV